MFTTLSAWLSMRPMLVTGAAGANSRQGMAERRRAR